MLIRMLVLAFWEHICALLEPQWATSMAVALFKIHHICFHVSWNNPPLFETLSKEKEVYLFWNLVHNEHTARK